MLLAVPGSPSRAQSPAPAGNARVIVKYKVDSPLLRRETLAAGSPRMSGREALSQRVGLSLRAGADVAERTQVLFASGMTSRALAARLARENDVEFAVPDERRHRFVVPSDPLYLTGPAIAGNTGGPVTGQWYLRAPAGDVQSSIDVEPAWTHTIGAPGVVVAVLDTGVRFDHADLLRVGAGGNLLSGYDMIQDPEVANDGDGRDADPSDPGDWLTQAEVTQSGGPFEDCGNVAEDSSWHGTQTAGIIAALTGNGIGMASVGRNVRVLPVRVLGKCGGFDSDIIAGMRWAVGLQRGRRTGQSKSRACAEHEPGQRGRMHRRLHGGAVRSHGYGRRRGRLGGQQRRARGQYAGELSRRHRRGRTSSRRDEGWLLRSRAGNRD